MPFEILSSIHTGTCLTSSHLPRQELKRLLKICFLSEFHLKEKKKTWKVTQCKFSAVKNIFLLNLFTALYATGIYSTD